MSPTGLVSSRPPSNRANPLGRTGTDLFGTVDRPIDYGVIGATSAWYWQVGFVVAGHDAALTLARERALALYSDARRAVRSQYWILVVMPGKDPMGFLATILLGLAGSVVGWLILIKALGIGDDDERECDQVRARLGPGSVHGVAHVGTDGLM